VIRELQKLFVILVLFFYFFFQYVIFFKKKTPETKKKPLKKRVPRDSVFIHQSALISSLDKSNDIQSSPA
jgi:hypothetical protein